MTVTKIEAVNKTRYKIYLEEKFAFVLYKGELSKYNIAAGNVISEELVEEIKKDVILKRAKLRALHLLNDMGRTEYQLRQKLISSDYTEDIIEKAIAYVKNFGYVNDEEYARSFIQNRKDKKSRKELYMQLSQKGISLENIDDIFEEYYDSEDSLEAIRKLAEKKRYNPETASLKETQRIFAYLMRKGFQYDDIRKVLS